MFRWERANDSVGTSPDFNFKWFTTWDHKQVGVLTRPATRDFNPDRLCTVVGVPVFEKRVIRRSYTIQDLLITRFSYLPTASVPRRILDLGCLNL